MRIADAVAELRALVHEAQLPTVCTLQALGALPADDPLFLGMLGMHGLKAANFAVQSCDLLVVVGARFDDRVTGRLDRFAPNARVLHLDVDPAEVGKRRAPDVAVVDPSNTGDGLRGRAAGVVDAVAGGACVAPEFFKSWLSRPGANLSQHVLHGSLESGKLAASVRASLGGVGAAPPAPNDAATSIPTASKAKARAKKAADATDKAAVPPPAESGRRKRKAAAAEPQPARYSRRALVVKN